MSEKKRKRTVFSHLSKNIKIGKLKLKTPVAAVIIALAVLIIAVVFVFAVNKFSVEISLIGDKTTVVNVGEKYEEKGAKATFKGTVIFTKPQTVKVLTEGEVKTDKPGEEYSVTYTAKHLWYSAKVTRKIVIRDPEAPVIELVTNPDSYTLPGREYTEEGYKATDNVDGDITDKVVREVKDGKVYYSVKDSSGNEATAERTIVYKDPSIPVVTLSGSKDISVYVGEAYNEPGYSASDELDGDLTNKVQVSGSVNTYAQGTYTLTYSVKDNYGNVGKAERKVTVMAKPQPKVPEKVDGSGKNIYLTFDDGPSQYTPALLDVLAKYGVKVTFFVTSSNPDIITREYNEGHSVGIHTASHDYSKIYASEEAYFADLNAMSDIILAKTGAKTNIMRFPGGSSNMVSRFNSGIMTRLTSAVQNAGYQYFDWNVTSGDAGNTTSTDVVYSNVINGISGKTNAIVLQHDTKKFSIDAVERIIIWGKNNGYTFLPLKYDSPTAHHRVNN